MLKFFKLMFVIFGFMMILTIQNELHNSVFSKIFNFEILDDIEKTDSESEENFKYSENFEKEFTQISDQFNYLKFTFELKNSVVFDYSVRYKSIHLEKNTPPPKFIS
ncbi:MAG: hypothetical protein RIR51_208 [Bacteroidota bacterium]